MSPVMTINLISIFSNHKYIIAHETPFGLIIVLTQLHPQLHHCTKHRLKLGAQHLPYYHHFSTTCLSRMSQKTLTHSLIYGGRGTFNKFLSTNSKQQQLRCIEIIVKIFKKPKAI